MKELWIGCGIPGSGKSYWAKKGIDADKWDIVISRDVIRFAKVSEDEEYFSKEKEVYKEFISQIKFALENDKRVFADATHLNQASRRKLLASLDKALTDVSVKAFVVDNGLDIALEQNENRKNTRAFVPHNVIRKMKEQFTYPTFDEGFDEIWTISRADTIIKVKEE